MMRQSFYIFSLFIITLAFGACKGSKAVAGDKAISGTSVTDLIDSHKKALPDFQTLASRVQVQYDDGDKSQSITVSLRMQKDEKIWLKASILGITLAKALITPESVSYYETISNTYFEGDFSLLSEWLGTDLNYEKAQAILLGQSIFSLEERGYKLSISENRYKLQPKRQPQNFIHAVFLNPGNFKVQSGSLSQPDENRLFSIHYGEYRTLEGGYYPSNIHINASQGDEKTDISVNYKHIDINPPVNFSFRIPNGFERIRLSK